MLDQRYNVKFYFRSTFIPRNYSLETQLQILEKFDVIGFRQSKNWGIDVWCYLFEMLL